MKKLIQKQFEEKQKKTSKYGRYKNWVEDYAKQIVVEYDKQFFTVMSQVSEKIEKKHETPTTK
jgi:hypothetical protein